MTATGNPFGDGLAGLRAEQAIARMLDLCTAPPDEFRPGKAFHQQTAVPTTANEYSPAAGCPSRVMPHRPVSNA
jgi:hypothetical protein